MRPKSKRAKQRLRKIADELWYRKYLKDRCEVCGCSNCILQGHHFFYKSSYGHLRYSKDNHITLCKSCHFLLHHQDPHRIEDKIIAVRGKKWLANLKKKAYNEPKGSYLTIKYYKDVIRDLQEYQEYQK